MIENIKNVFEKEPALGRGLVLLLLGVLSSFGLEVADADGEALAVLLVALVGLVFQIGTRGKVMPVNGPSSGGNDALPVPAPQENLAPPRSPSKPRDDSSNVKPGQGRFIQCPYCPQPGGYFTDREVDRHVKDIHLPPGGDGPPRLLYPPTFPPQVRTFATPGSDTPSRDK